MVRESFLSPESGVCFNLECIPIGAPGNSCVGRENHQKVIKRKKELTLLDMSCCTICSEEIQFVLNVISIEVLHFQFYLCTMILLLRCIMEWSIWFILQKILFLKTGLYLFEVLFLSFVFLLRVHLPSSVPLSGKPFYSSKLESFVLTETNQILWNSYPFHPVYSTLSSLTCTKERDKTKHHT